MGKVVKAGKGEIVKVTMSHPLLPEIVIYDKRDDDLKKLQLPKPVKN